MGRRAHHKHSDAGPDDAKADLAVILRLAARGRLKLPSQTEVSHAVEEAPGRELSRARSGDAPGLAPRDRTALELSGTAAFRKRWSGRRESNPHIQLGKLTFYH